MDLHNRKLVVTRKDHKCEGCFDIIPQGTETLHCKGRYDGDFYDYHMCLPCDNYISEYMDPIDGFTPGEIGDHRKESMVS